MKKKARPTPASSFHRVACPHLGRQEARHSPLGRPNDAHRCFLSVSSGESVTHRHQAQCCLSPDWHQCYRLQADYIPVDTLATAALPALDPSKPPTPREDAPLPKTPTAKLSPLTQRLMARAEKQREAQPPEPIPPPRLRKRSRPSLASPR